MALKTKHKLLIGSFTTIVLIYIIASSVFIYLILAKQEYDYNQLDGKIDELQADTQSKINDLSSSISEANKALDIKVGSLSSELSSLKASASADFSGIIEEVVTGVVTIKTDVSQGTGFLITDDGYVVTNYHVMQNAKAATIVTSDSQNHQVTFIGYDTNLDIALLKISGNYDSLRLADSDDVQVGEKVIAIGNPLGLQFSVSEGIVSAVHREGANNLEAYIQTDAALNPGNSGGPLIDTSGKVIGINNFKIGGGENLGFALESNYIKEGVNGIALEGLNETLI